MKHHRRAFWNHFAATVWGKTPVVLRAAFDTTLATRDEVFEAALEAARRYADPRRLPQTRAYLGAKEQRDATPLLASTEDRSLDGYVRRLQQVPSDDGFGVMMMQFQSTHDAIWNRVTRFFADLTHAVGVPIGGSHLDCFVMNQRRGFIGVHKDAQDVFTTVVSGRKRMLLWPFERLRDAAGQGEQLRQRGWKLGHLDDPTLRADAIVLEAEPGDIIYWPADYWHNSESDGESVVTVALGVVRTADPARFAQLASSALTRAQTTPPASAPDLSRDGVAGAMSWLDSAIAGVFGDPRYREQLENSFMRWLTGCGFDEVPALAPSLTLEDDAWVVGCGAPLFAYQQRRTTLAIWSHGNAIDLPAHPALAKLCDAIAAGARLRVGTFLDDAVADETPDRRGSTRDKLAVVLRHLVRARALAPAPLEHAAEQLALDERYSTRTHEAPLAP